MEHVDSDFAPIRRSKKVVDSDKIVKAISDDLEQKNFTVLRKLNLVPIKKSVSSPKVCKPSPVKERVDHVFYQKFKSMALQELGTNYLSISYVPSLSKFLSKNLRNMKNCIVFFDKVEHIHQYAGIDRAVSETLSLVDINVVIIEMNDYLMKEGIQSSKSKECIESMGQASYSGQLDFEAREKLSNHTSDLMMMVMRKINNDESIDHIVYFKFEQLDKLSTSTIIEPSKFTEFINVLSVLEKSNNIAFKVLIYSNNVSISSLLSTSLKKKLNTKCTVFEMPILTCAQEQEYLKKMIKFTFDFGNKLLQSYNSLVTCQLNNKESNLAIFFEFLKVFPHPFTYLFNAYTEIIVQSRTFDELLDKIRNRLTIKNYPHSAYNFKKNQRLPLKLTRKVHDR